MDPKKLSIRLSAKGKKEEKAGKEDRRLAPMMRALKAIHSVGAPDSMNPEDLAKQRGWAGASGQAGGTNDCHEKVGALFPQRDGRCLGEA